MRLLQRKSLATWGSLCVKALPVFLLPPFIFARFAPDETAIWFILITLQGMQLLIAASTGQPMVRGFAYALGGATQVRDMRNVKPSGQSEPNIALLSRVWSASAFAHILIAIATLALLGAMGVWSAAPLISTHSQDQSLWAALAVFVLGGALRAYGGLHVSYLMGVDRIPLLRWWEAAFWLLAFISALTTLLSGGGLLALAIAYQIPLALNIGWNAWLCRRDHRARSGFQTGVRADRDILAQMWPSIWRTGLGTTVAAVAMRFAVLGVARELSPDQSSAMMYFYSVVVQIGRFAQVPFSVSLPKLARMQANGEIPAQRAVVKKSASLTYLLHMLLVCLFILYIFLTSHEALFASTPLWLLFAAAGMLERVSAIHTQWYTTTNHVIFHWLNTASAILLILILYFLMDLSSPASVPIAHSIRLVGFYVPIAIFLTRKQFGASYMPEMILAFPFSAIMFFLGYTYYI